MLTAHQIITLPGSGNRYLSTKSLKLSDWVSWWRLPTVPMPTLCLLLSVVPVYLSGFRILLEHFYASIVLLAHITAAVL